LVRPIEKRDELVKAAHNDQLSRTDPGARAHNFDDLAQLLLDSTSRSAEIPRA
jgi:hypothetical protein